MLLDLALIGLAMTLDPVPLTAFTVVLPSQRGRKGAAFVFGWLVSLAIVVTAAPAARIMCTCRAGHAVQVS
jgi:hypothetical protein